MTREEAERFIRTRVAEGMAHNTVSAGSIVGVDFDAEGRPHWLQQPAPVPPHPIDEKNGQGDRPDRDW